MKCNTWVEYVQGRKRKDGTRGLRVERWIHQVSFAAENFTWASLGIPKGENPKDHGWVLCDGEDITVTVAAEDEPHYGGTSASLEIEYKCQKCNSQYYPHLPSAYDISEFMTQALAGMAPLDEERLAEKYIEGERKHREQMVQFRKESEARKLKREEERKAKQERKKAKKGTK